MGININCIYYDGYGYCNLKERKIFGFKRACLDYPMKEVCTIKVPFPRPDVLPPAPPPKKEKIKRKHERI